ncbi:DnaJ domain-containing protein [Sphingomonas sp.]|uniref:J domain-containing protein n=1 Tax=Sphingomonas sp. TaxID=28214 RepID=UPI0025E38C40|nr:DnaJ domain-containing protein [Sphingomonas sp.]
MAKFLIGVLLAWLGWRLWHGWGRPLPGTPKPAPAPTARDPEEAAAYAILGVAPGADPDEIRAAHRRLITSVHPDRGGSPELTRQVNAARDMLLKPKSDPKN